MRRESCIVVASLFFPATLSAQIDVLKDDPFVVLSEPKHTGNQTNQEGPNQPPVIGSLIATPNPAVHAEGFILSAVRVSG